MDSNALFNAVPVSPEQVVHFLLCNCSNVSLVYMLATVIANLFDSGPLIQTSKFSMTSLFARRYMPLWHFFSLTSTLVQKLACWLPKRIYKLFMIIFLTFWLHSFDIQRLQS